MWNRNMNHWWLKINPCIALQWISKFLTWKHRNINSKKGYFNTIGRQKINKWSGRSVAAGCLFWSQWCRGKYSLNSSIKKTAFFQEKKKANWKVYIAYIVVLSKPCFYNISFSLRSTQVNINYQKIHANSEKNWKKVKYALVPRKIIATWKTRRKNEYASDYSPQCTID